MPVELPEEVRRVTDGFITALRRGDTQNARSYVADIVQPDFDKEFTGKDAFRPDPELRPVAYTSSESPANYGQYRNKARVLYAVEGEKGWQTLDLRLYWLDGEDVFIDDWYLSNDGPPPMEVAAQKAVFKVLPWMMMAFAMLGILALAIIIWLAKRRPEIIAPGNSPVKRGGASTHSREE